MDPLQGYVSLKGKIVHTSLTPYKDAYYVLFVMGPLQPTGLWTSRGQDSTHQLDTLKGCLLCAILWTHYRVKSPKGQDSTHQLDTLKGCLLCANLLTHYRVMSP